jgi:hypothetical protein
MTASVTNVNIGHYMAVLGLRMEETAPDMKVAANILNKQSQTVDKRWSSSLGLGEGADNASP